MLVEGKSVMSGGGSTSAMKKNEQLTVNFNVAPGSQMQQPKDSNQEYDIPTLERLNPELYKEYATQ